jgi:hypothetical protein
LPGQSSDTPAIPALRRSLSVIGIALTGEQRRPFGALAISCVESVCFVLFNIMSTVHEILNAMDKLTHEELRILKLGVDSRLADDDNDPALLASLKEAIAYADAHPTEARSIDEVRALIPQWISESKSQARP